GAGCDGVSERLLRALHLAQDEPRSARERPGKRPVGLVEIATHIRRATAGLVSLDGKEEASSVVVQSRSKARERAFVVAAAVAKKAEIEIRHHPFVRLALERFVRFSPEGRKRIALTWLARDENVHFGRDALGERFGIVVGLRNKERRKDLHPSNEPVHSVVGERFRVRIDERTHLAAPKEGVSVRESRRPVVAA